MLKKERAQNPHLRIEVNSQIPILLSISGITGILYEDVTE